MGTVLQLTILTLSSLLYLCKAQRIDTSTSTTTNAYLNIEVGWGTPKQTFKVLVDTTDHTSWVYNQTVNTKQSKFNPSKSSSYKTSSKKATFTYQTENITIEFANDTLTIPSNSRNIINTSFAITVGTANFSITDTQSTSGFLCLDRLSDIVPALEAAQYIKNKSVSIDVGNNKLHFGKYIPSNINNQSNATAVSTTINAELNKIWTFDIKVYVDGAAVLPQSKIKGVIDSASPYITIYTTNEANYLPDFWHYIDKSTGNSFNCNYTTRICDDVNSIMEEMMIVMPDVNWNISFFRSDIVVDKKMIQFFYDPDPDYTTEGDTDYVLFLGRPFLKHVLATMDYDEETITFYSLKESTSSINWVTVIIVFACVVAFALLFFGLYYWKFGKISPPSNNDVEEQVSLLRGPVQAVGSSQPGGNIQQAQSSGWSGVSGLDEDEDEQKQIQQAQRLSAIEAQQRREHQMREDRERQQAINLDEQKQQAQLQRSENKKQQQIGGSEQKPQDANELRQRRLKFLEEQQKKQQDDQ